MADELKPATEAGPAGDEAHGRVKFWRRVKEHRVVQWGLGYTAVAYGIQHAVTLTLEALEWPHEIERASMILLILGLPLAMTFAWYHGEQASRNFSRAELSIVAILLVISSLLFYVFVHPQQEIVSHYSPMELSIAAALLVICSLLSYFVVRPSKNSTKKASVTKTQSALVDSGVTHPDMSIAVLPLLNLSGDPNQDFFSDGMTEEITTALAKVKGLRVVARTSAFQFKGNNRDMVAIGAALHATNLIEGSVRKDGNDVRITVQLIRADDGTHLWAENYDRELKGVFAVQDDIAQAIASALQIPLGLKQGQHLVSNRTNNTDSYQDYLRARPLYRARDIDRAILILEQAVASDPGYAPSWALLAQTYILAPSYISSLYDGTVDQVSERYRVFADKAERAAQKALDLDPRSASAHAALAEALAQRLEWIGADDHYRQALAIDSNDPDILNLYSINLLANAGYLKQAIGIREKLSHLEPFVPVYNIVTASMMLYQRQFEAAIKMLQLVPAGGPTGYIRNKYLALALADTGRYDEAADALLAIPPTPMMSRTVIENAARFLRAAPAIPASASDLPSFELLGFVYAFIGVPNRAFELPERLIAINAVRGSAFGEIWDPVFSPLRSTENFKAFLRKAKLVDYWRARGWPDVCHPVGADDFACN